MAAPSNCLSRILATVNTENSQTAERIYVSVDGARVELFLIPIGRRIQVYQSGKLHCIVELSDPVKDVALAVCAENVDGWALTTHQLYRFTVPLLFSSETDLQKEETRDDVFAELLEKDDACDVAMETVPVIKNVISYMDVEDAVTFCVSAAHVCIITAHPQGWLLSTYGRQMVEQQQQQAPEAKKLDTCPNIRPVMTTFLPKVPSHSLTTPDKYPTSGSDSLQLCSHSDIKLLCVRTEARDSESCRFNHECVISQALYNKLFGLKTNLLSLPGLIVGTQQGLVYSIHLEFYNSGRSKYNLICDIGQPVVALGSACLPWLQTSDAGLDCNCIFMIGFHGKIALMYISNDDICVRSMYIRGPVLHIDWYEEYIVHSTGKHVYVTPINEQVQHLPNGSLLKSLQLPFTSVIGLAVGRQQGISWSPSQSLQWLAQGQPLQAFQGTPKNTAGAGDLHAVCLLLLTAAGRLMEVKYTIGLNMENALSADQDVTQSCSQLQKLSSTANVFGDQLKTVLEGIRQVAEHHARVKQSLECQRIVLTQLALLSHIVTSQHHRPAKSSKHAQQEQSPLVQCKVHSQHGVGGEHLLVVSLHRSSLCRFTAGWTFVVTVNGACHASSQHSDSLAVNQQSTSSGHCKHHKSSCMKGAWSISKSRPINTLILNSDTTVKIALPSDILHQLPLTVQPVLIYSRCLSGGDQLQGHASVCLQPHTVDLLSLLSPSTTSILPPHISREQHISQLTDCHRRCADTTRDLKPAASSPPSVMSFVFRESSLIHSPDAGYGVSLLRQLLRDVPLLVSDLSKPVVTAVTPDSQQVTLRIQEASAQSSDAVKKLELYVQASGISHMCLLHSAISQHLHKMLKTGSLSLTEVRAVLHAVEELHVEVRHLQDSMSDSPSDAYQQQLLHLYTRLRSISLPF